MSRYFKNVRKKAHLEAETKIYYKHKVYSTISKSIFLSHCKKFNIFLHDFKLKRTHISKSKKELCRWYLAKASTSLQIFANLTINEVGIVVVLLTTGGSR